MVKVGDNKEKYGVDAFLYMYISAKLSEVNNLEEILYA